MSLSFLLGLPPTLRVSSLANYISRSNSHTSESAQGGFHESQGQQSVALPQGKMVQGLQTAHTYPQHP